MKSSLLSQICDSQKLIELLERISSTTSGQSSKLKGSTIISLSDDELNLESAMVSDITDTPNSLRSTQARESKERKSMLAVSTKLTSNLPYNVPSFAFEVNEARKKAGLKVGMEEKIEEKSIQA